MKIGLIGYGKMGKIIEKMGLEKGHTFVGIDDADICIDFSHPNAVLDNVKKTAKAGKNLVMGTTGWHEHLNEVKRIVEEANIGFLYASNFSLGIALFLKMISNAAQLMASHDCYDASGIEIHHNQKVDQPSGTAKTIMEHLSREGTEISFSSVRVGSVPGTHSVIFDSPADTITLTHTARNREGFASGALQAAEWLLGKKGFFTLDDMLFTKNLN